MLGKLATILQQIAQALTTGTIPVALATIAIAVVGILLALGRISLMMMVLSVPVPSLRYTVQRAQRRCPKSRLAAERHYRLRGVLPAALQADTAGSQRDHAVARVHCQP
jgi:hypothetical protein